MKIFVAFYLFFEKVLYICKKKKSMIIDKITLGGISNIERVSLSLSGIDALIAPNNYGKSNILHAIDFGLGFIRASANRKKKSMCNSTFIPINKRLEGNPFIFELEGILELNKQKISYIYGYSFEWAKTGKGVKGSCITEEYLKLKGEQETKYKSYINRTPAVSYYLASPTGRCSKSIQIDDDLLVLNKLQNFDELFYLEVLKNLTKFERNNVDTLQNPDSYFGSISILDSETFDGYSLSMPENQTKISLFIKSLEQESPEKFNLFKDAIIALLPNIEDFKPIKVDLKKEFESDDEKLPFRLPDVFYDIQVKEKCNNQYTTIRRLSTGCKKIFCVLTLAIAADINKLPLLTFEELENSVHTYLFRQMLETLSNLAGNTKILLTSHSPYLIQYLDPAQVKIGLPNHDCIADFREIKQSKLKKVLRNASVQEETLGEYLFDLMLNEEADEEFLKEYFI